MEKPPFQFGLKAVFGAMTVSALLVSGWLGWAVDSVFLATSVVVRDGFFWLLAFLVSVGFLEVISRRRPPGPG